MVRPSISSSSGAVFFERVGCHDPPWLPILSKSHEVFVTHSRPFCDVCHPLRYWPSSWPTICILYLRPIRSWPSSASFPLQWTLQQQPVDVVTSDHVTKVGNFSFLCWNYVKLFVCQCKDFFIYFISPPPIFSSSSDMPTFQTIAILSYFWWLLSTFHIRIKVSTTHMLL